MLPRSLAPSLPRPRPPPPPLSVSASRVRGAHTLPRGRGALTPHTRSLPRSRRAPTGKPSTAGSKRSAYKLQLRPSTDSSTSGPALTRRPAPRPPPLQTASAWSPSRPSCAAAAHVDPTQARRITRSTTTSRLGKVRWRRRRAPRRRGQRPPPRARGGRPASP